MSNFLTDLRHFVMNMPHWALIKSSCFLSLFTFFIIFKASAQTTTFSGTEVNTFTENDFAPIFERFNIYELNSTAFDGFVKDDNYDSQVRLNFGNIFDWDMTLFEHDIRGCLLYTSPSPRDATLSRMPSSA